MTELVYGVDLVEQQLRVAAGEPLALRAGRRSRRAAMRSRRACTPRIRRAGFLPATGTVRVYREPAGAGVRVDSGIRGRQRGRHRRTTRCWPRSSPTAPDRATALAPAGPRAGRASRSSASTTNAAFTARAAGARRTCAPASRTPACSSACSAELAGAPPDDLVPAAAMVAAAGTRPAGRALAAARSTGTARRACATAASRVGERAWAAARGRASTRDGARRASTLDGVERRYAVARRRRRGLDRPRRPPSRGAHRARDARRRRRGGRLAGGADARHRPARQRRRRRRRRRGRRPARPGVDEDGAVDHRAARRARSPASTLAPGDRVALGQPLVAVVAPDAEEAA